MINRISVASPSPLRKVLKAYPALERLLNFRYLYLMILIAVLFYLIFHYLPMYGVVVAFKKYDVMDGILGSPWAGLKYFEQVFSDRLFWEAVRNTIVLNVLRLIFGFPAPIIIALMLNEMVNLRFKRISQTIMYLPHFISWVIIGSILMQFLTINYGLVNNIIKHFGGKPIAFMQIKALFRPIIILSAIWKNAGYGSIIYLASLTGINPELYEAATVDGAGRFRQLFHITLPGIRPTIIVMFLLSLSQTLNFGFDQIWVLINSMVLEVGEIIDTYVYRTGILNGRYSYATAAGLFKSLIGLCLILSGDRLAKKFFDGQGIL